MGSLRVPRSALSQARPEFTYGKAVLTDAWLAASVSFRMYVFQFVSKQFSVLLAPSIVIFCNCIEPLFILKLVVRPFFSRIDK